MSDQQPTPEAPRDDAAAGQPPQPVPPVPSGAPAQPTSTEPPTQAAPPPPAAPPVWPAHAAGDTPNPAAGGGDAPAAPPPGAYPPPPAGYAGYAAPGYPPPAYSAPGYAYPPPGYPGYAPAPTTSTSAVVGLVLAIASWAVCPIVLAIVALVLAKKSGDEIAASQGQVSGEGLNTATKVIAWINIGLYAALAVIFGAIFLIALVAGAASGT